MRVKVTKTMAKALNQGCYNMRIQYHTVDIEYYERYIDRDILEHTNDFVRDKEGRMCVKVLRVIYPQDYFAMPGYASTNDLLRIVRRNNVRTVGELCAAFQQEYEV